MIQANYIQTVKDSQSFSDFDQIIRSLTYVAATASDVVPKPYEYEGRTYIELESPKQKLDYILIGLKNTKAGGYVLVKEDKRTRWQIILDALFNKKSI